MLRTTPSSGLFENAWIMVSPDRNVFVMPNRFITPNVRVWNSTNRSNAAVLKSYHANRATDIAIRDAGAIPALKF